MGSGRIHAVPLTMLLAVGRLVQFEYKRKRGARPVADCAPLIIRARRWPRARQDPRRLPPPPGQAPEHLACRHPPGKPFETIMGDLFNVLTIELRIRGPQPKSMLRTKRHRRKHLVAPCVPDLRLEKIGLNTHGLRISPGERLQKGITAPLHFLILCHGSRTKSWRGRRCARNFIPPSSWLPHWL